MSENPIQIEMIPVAPLGVNCAILMRGDAAVVIDPGGDAPVIEDTLAGARLEAILLTHCHYDHIGAVNTLCQSHPDAALVCHADTAPLIQDPMQNFSQMIAGVTFSAKPPDRQVADEERFTYAGIEIQAFLIPGHCDGQLAFYVPDAHTLFSGDTVFAGGVGRSDLPGGDGVLLAKTIRRVLESLPPETGIYPGHGPHTTAALELERNPYL